VNVDAALSRLGLTRLRLGSFGIMPPEPEDLAEPVPGVSRFRWCRRCDVKWYGLPACWCCGRTAAGIG
jgi:hypothetical protein